MRTIRKILLILLTSLLMIQAFQIKLYAEDDSTQTQDETSDFDKLGSKTVDENKTELDEEHRETTVTLQLPSAEYQKKLDVVFVIDTSSSIGNSSYDFTPYVTDLFSGLLDNNPNLVIKVAIVKYTGYAVDGIKICSDDAKSGLIEYSDDVSDLIQEAIQAPSKKDFDKGKYPDWTGHTIPGGGSNIHSGLVLADQILKADTEVDDMNKYVILLSDCKSYMWNNKDNEPTSYYVQYRAKRNNIANNGRPSLAQVAGNYMKEQSNASTSTPFSPYANLPATPEHPAVIAYKPRANAYDQSDYYTTLHNMEDEDSPFQTIAKSHELSKTDTKYDAPAYYSLYYEEETAVCDPDSSTVVAKTISNTNSVFSNSTHRSIYGTYYIYTPAEGTVWADINYLTLTPYEVEENDGVYTYTTTPDEDFYLYHVTPIEKGLYQAGHYWSDVLMEKYNVAAVMQYDTGSGGGTHICGSFGEWMIENSPYGAHLISNDADDPDKEVEKMFEDLDNSMSYVVNTGVVTDEIPDEFTLVEPEGASPFRMTYAGEELTAISDDGWLFGTADDEGAYPYVVKYDSETKTITWTINVPVENLKPITLSYDLEIAEDAEAGEHDTNKSAILNYVTTDGKEGEFTFPVPKVTYTVVGEYIVRHFTQNLDGETYAFEREDEKKTGNVGAIVTAEAATFTGFTFDNSIEGTIETAELVQGEITYLYLFYTRNKHTVTYRYTGTRPGNASALPATATYMYGQNVTVAAAASAAGYTFSGWSRTGSFKMPDADVTITGSFTANTTPPVIPTPDPDPEPEETYTVNYILNGGTTVSPSVSFTDLHIGDTTPRISDPTREGYVFNGWSPEVQSTVTGNATYSANWTAEEIIIPEPDPPLAGGNWALINLLSSIATVITGAGMLVTYFKKKNEEEDEKDGKKVQQAAIRNDGNADDDDENKRKKSKFLGIIPAIGSVIAFILTEDMSLPMVLADKWTLLMLVILLINILLAFFTRNKGENEEDGKQNSRANAAA